MVQLRKLWGGGNSYIPLAQRAPRPDPNAMDINRINLSPSEKVEHLRNWKCFIYHKEGHHLSKHRGYPGKRGGRGGRPPPQGECSWRKPMESTREVRTNLLVADYMKQHGISLENTVELLRNYYSHNNTAITWEKPAEELVDLVNLDFLRGRKGQCLLFLRTLNPYL